MFSLSLTPVIILSILGLLFVILVLWCILGRRKNQVEYDEEIQSLLTVERYGDRLKAGN